jgi:hypothetical protein
MQDNGNQRVCHMTDQFIVDGEPTVHASGLGGEINRQGFQMLVGYQIRKLLAIGECTVAEITPNLEWELFISAFHAEDPLWWDARHQYATNGDYEAMHHCSGNQTVEYLRDIVQFYDVCNCFNISERGN